MTALEGKTAVLYLNHRCSPVTFGETNDGMNDFQHRHGLTQFDGILNISETIVQI